MISWITALLIPSAFWSLHTLTFFIVGFTIFYKFTTRNFDRWSSQGLPGPTPLPLIGTLWPIIFKPISRVVEDQLKKYGTVYGEFEGSTPVLSVSDPELIKTIMIKDFHAFVNRRQIKFNEPLLDRSVNTVVNDEWKQMRSVISPAFSSGKMRKMHRLVEDCAKDLEAFLKNKAEDGAELDLKQIVGNYTMQVIACCAFATRIDTHNDPNNPFIKNALKLFRLRAVKLILFFIAYPLMKLLRIPVVDSDMINFFKNALETIINRRRREPRDYHDFLQLLLQAQRDGKIEQEKSDGAEAEDHHDLVEGESSLNLKGSGGLIIGEDEVIANSFVFLLAGYATTMHLISWLFYLFAVKPDCQEQLYQEIANNQDEEGNVNYETISRLPYLDACISETLRLFNPAIATERTANEDYKIPNRNITIRKGERVKIQIHAVHHNLELYPEPHQFKPDRFLPENRANIKPYTYLPFGAGPRNCIGMRFALMEAKTAVARMVSKFRFVRSESTKSMDQLEFMKGTNFVDSKNPLKIGIELR